MVNLNEDDIKSIEEFVREEGLNHATKMLQQKVQCNSDVLLQENQLVDYFGEIYASDPSNFRFVIGDKKLIRLVRDHLIENQNEHGAKYMRRFRKKPDRENKIIRAPQTEHHAIDNIEDTNEALCSELSASLFERLKVFMKSFGIDDSIIQTMTQNSVSVKIVNGNVASEIFCALCQFDTTKKRKLNGKKVYYKNGSNSKYWVLSNFKEHLKTVHKVTCNQSVEDDDGIENDVYNESENKLLLDTDSRVAPTIKEANKKTKKLQLSLATTSTAKDQNIDEVALAHNFTFEYVTVDVVPLDTHNSNTQHGFNDQSELIFSQISTQLNKILAATLSNNDTTEQMVFELAENELQTSKVAKISPNGACTFGSFVHQLTGCKANSDEHIQAAKQIRMNIVKHISNHYSSFQKELRDRVYAEINSKSIKDIDKECKIILNNFLPLDYYWGGAETLKAMRELYRCNILVLNERGTCHFFNHFNEKYNRTLILAFRLENKTASKIDIDSYNHYDSVCEISSDGILQIIEHLNERARKMNIEFNDTL